LPAPTGSITQVFSQKNAGRRDPKTESRNKKNF